MPTYIVLGNFTDQGIRNIKDTAKRAQAVRDTARKLGITVKETYWTLGRYDVALILDAPDEAAGLAAIARLTAELAGGVRRVSRRPADQVRARSR